MLRVGAKAILARLLYLCCRSTYRAYWFGRLAIMGRVARAYLRLHGVSFGQRLNMHSLLFCQRHRLAAIEIGSDVSINNRPWENPAGISHRTHLVATQEGSRLVIGNSVGMSGVVLYCSREIVIEDHVNLGVGVMVYDTDFHPIDACARRAHDRTKTRSAPVRICEDAWIGAKAIILKGVTVGPRAVVAAGSVVTRDVPSDCVVAGVPAKVVRSIQKTNRQGGQPATEGEVCG